MPFIDMAKQAIPSRQKLARPVGYFERSQQPLQSLIFLLPLVVIYEVGALLMHKAAIASGEQAVGVRAHLMLNHFFEIFGVTSFYLPGIVVVIVLFCWHLARKPGKDDWRISPKLYALMGLECLALSIPMLIWGMVFLRKMSATDSSVAMLAASLPIPDELLQELIISIGAGIYEELLFRLMGLVGLHMIFVDLLALPDRVGTIGAVAISAMAFGLYHFPSLAFSQWSGYDWARFVFYTLGGVFLSIVYIMRGFGIVAGTHALYDILLTLLAHSGG